MSTYPKFSLEEYDRMIELGVFDSHSERRIELIHGELREMTPAGPTHEDAVDFLTCWSIENVDKNQVRVRIQNSIGLPESDSAPEPDVAWVKAGSYRDERPGAEVVLLVIEVADSSLVTDQREKANLYAEAGIPEYWIVNIPHWRIDCYRDPAGDTYQSVVRYDMTTSVSPLAFPGVKLKVRELFQS